MYKSTSEKHVGECRINILRPRACFLMLMAAFAALVCAAAVLTVSVSAAFRISASDRLYTCGQVDASSDEYSESARERLEAFDADAVLILGAMVWGDRPSYVLEDRIITGSKLYLDGFADAILMSGDNQREDYNELDPMMNYAETKMGVPRDGMLCDRLGLNTYTSVIRAKEQYGLERVIIVSQEFHLPRALYIADKIGLEAVGVSADLRPYGSAPKSAVREYAARVKEFFKLIQEQ